MKHNELMARENFNLMTKSLGNNLVRLSQEKDYDYDEVYTMVKLLTTSYLNAITPIIVDDKED